ncbi:hypothetical protein AB0N06_37710 [Streptomyces sp. NPDC051020]|uniref:hypothetical protein n=1 Tax=Streptomyces sp. NPDC051020 TaxID=3155409 RepID=UPI00344355D3
MIVKSLAAQDAIPVTEGRSYGVYGLAQYASRVIVLIASDDGRPNWCPVEWFRVVDGRFPSGWELSVVDPGGTALQVLIGYPELVKDPDHYDALLERDPEAISIFKKFEIAQGGFSVSPSEDFLSNFGVVPKSTEGNNRSSISLDAPNGYAIDLQWDAVMRSAEWRMSIGGVVMVEQVLGDVRGISVFCENQESGLILRADSGLGGDVKIYIYPYARVAIGQ